VTEVSNGELPGPAAAPQDPGAGRHDAFLSYARQDRVAVDRLAAALKAHGKDVWVDVEDIVGGANWRARIKRGIEACSAFVFVLSPAALRSAQCRQELDQAVELNKLIVPVYHRQVEEGDVPAALADREWIFLRDTDAFESGLAKLVEALETDLAWRDQHTRIAGRAREWLDTGRDRSYLLRGSDLREAESWLAQQADHRQGATAEQARYIVESRSNASSRQRMLLTGVGVGLVVAVALAVFALVQRNDAVRQEHVATEQKRTAQSGRLAAEAQLELNSDPSLAGVLNLEAYRLQPTLEARSAALTTVARLGRAQGALRGHSQGVFAVAFSPDGKTLVSAGNDSTLRLWDVAHREALGRPINPRYITHAAVSPDFKTLVTTDDRTVRFWDRAGRELGASLDGYHVNAMAFSPDGKLLATAGEDPGGDGLVQLWDVARRQPAGAPFVGHWQAVNSVAFSPDGRTLVQLRVSCWHMMVACLRDQEPSHADRPAAGDHRGRTR
jgi:hypothetical protein